MAKYSDPQIKAIEHVHATGEVEGLNQRTVTSLVNKGVLWDEPEGWFVADDVINDLSLGEGEWQGAPSASVEASYMHITDTELSEAQAVQEVMFGVEEKDVPYAQWELDAMGFGAWRKTEGAWDGLSIKEIKEDIKTAFGVNRKARRLHTKILTSECRKMFCPRPRKTLKITGKVGV